ncbi:hypothetical protein GCM10010112_16100 [Actinoplanes lobatus]|uniref:ABC-type nickel/cobalt efflux system permease component RcnA n=1 Tax=Actinoplanes lobatus TaxID=113568 RepID=A0A7W7HMV4_9ACTN|nr:hypothetical protein [Actinoplanes lobatus]MBB4753440.1 ABC-type nickel/cobalt efflux system permease component RcnA [Actinoplanes lobatus]GGN60158.1 hypothetical protein GCM10010112_16100 [Actinoplanes lobatus]GIE37972.1 hypothetical protein Alo02nite_08700 [Actinoplanes lobatus]
MRIRLGMIAVIAGLLLWPAQPAEAHPVDSFSVNQYAGLTLYPGRIDVTAAVDAAEIPTLQEKPLVDVDGDGVLSPAERAVHAAAECQRLAAGLAVSAGGERLVWTVADPRYEVLPGSGGLSISRLDCVLSAPARLSGATTIQIDNDYRSDRVGWREITANGAGIALSESALPTESVTDGLRTYPTDLLASPPDVRSATVGIGGATSVGGSGATGGGAGGSAAATGNAPDLTGGPRWLAAAQTRVETTVGGQLTPLVVGLAFLLALLLGAGHAVLPGHGKTIMAAYFAGRQGRIRDALAVGGTVTLTHTGTVLALGLLLSTSTALAGERALSVLGIVSGLLVVAVGATMLISALRSRSSGAHSHGWPGHSHTHGPHTHTHTHTHGPRSHTHGPHGHTHASGPHGHAHGAHSTTHSHDPDDHAYAHCRDDVDPSGHNHPHTPHSRDERAEQARQTGKGEQHDRAPRRTRRWLGLAGIGLAGGLVPSPSALVVLLGAIGLGRAGLGVALVIAYGLGMAATLTAIGLLLVVAQNRLSRLITSGGRAAHLGSRLSHLGARLAATAPTATAALVVIVGLGIGLRAAAA